MFFDLDFDALLLGLLSFILGKRGLAASKEKERPLLSRLLSRLLSLIFLFSGVLYVCSAITCGFGKGPEDGDDPDGDDFDEEDEEA